MDRDIAAKKQSLWLAKLGIILYTGPVWGILGTIIGMIGAFSTLQTGDADPAALAQKINIALISTLIGMAVGIIGAILILIVLYKGKSLPLWFFWVTIILSVFWCILHFPFGAIIGAPTGVLFAMRRKEFGK